MPQPCTLIATAIPNPENMDAMKTYMQKAGPLFDALGAGPANRLKVSEVVAGDGTAIVLVMDFPDRDKLSAMFESDSYQALIPARSGGFKSINIWIAEPM
ncbi:MAG: DUF1330 domain-containing protein [Proteobacteria bacterium]|nr:DUF1330 domain-containing protein [Pseudomonadota bacterium]